MLRGTKKRRVMTNELIGKFRSKSDFMKYFSENRTYPFFNDVLFCSVQFNFICPQRKW